jgi:hypothetical protein
VFRALETPEVGTDLDRMANQLEDDVRVGKRRSLSHRALSCSGVFLHTNP